MHGPGVLSTCGPKLPTREHEGSRTAGAPHDSRCGWTLRTRVRGALRQREQLNGADVAGHLMRGRCPADAIGSGVGSTLVRLLAAIVQQATDGRVMNS